MAQTHGRLERWLILQLRLRKPAGPAAASPQRPPRSASSLSLVVAPVVQRAHVAGVVQRPYLVPQAKQQLPALPKGIQVHNVLRWQPASMGRQGFRVGWGPLVAASPSRCLWACQNSSPRLGSHPTGKSITPPHLSDPHPYRPPASNPACLPACTPTMKQNWRWASAPRRTPPPPAPTLCRHPLNLPAP